MKDAMPVQETRVNELSKAGGRTYWRSLEELADTPEFRKHLENEFPSLVDQFADPVSRRNFLGLMGAAIALSSLPGCRRPLAKILPYSKLPEDLLPGVPQTYATVLPFRGVGEGVLVTSNEGRPTKIEGNPEHPSSRGATHGFAQASILQLYDPDRSKTPLQGGVPKSWDDFAAWIAPRMISHRSDRGARLRFLSESSASPAARALRDQLLAEFPAARWTTYDAVHRDHVVEGSRIAFHRPLRTHLQLDQADVVVSLDADFLFTEPNSVRHARDFARRRRVTSEKDSMNRLYVVEPSFTVTGSMADHRLRLRRLHIPEFARALASALTRAQGIVLPVVGGGRVSPVAEAWAAAVAGDLAAHRGRSVVLAGSAQSPEVHALVHAINRALGNVGPVVRYSDEPLAGDSVASLRDLALSMEAGEVETLFILGGNPAFDAPADLGLAEKMEKVASTVRFGLYEDETSARADWHLPMAHFLECWGDAEAWDGTRSVQQPLIAPLYDGKGELEFLALLLGRPRADGHWLVQDFYTGQGMSDAQWNRALHDGLVAGTGFVEVPASADYAAVAGSWSAHVPAEEGGLEAVFLPDCSVWDGRFANNGWLQELPDPMTKLVWDNAAYLSLPTARELGVKEGDLVAIRIGDHRVTLPACPLPGVADGSLILPMGYGRTKAGRIGNGIGFDVQSIRTTAGMNVVAGITVETASGHHRLVRTQDHQSMEGRALVREGTLEEYRRDPAFAKEMVEEPPAVTLYANREYDYSQGPQWGMAIDLNTCIGCNACAIACQSENNVPIVGKDQVYRGREMHWLRIDRYYVGETEDPAAAHQPVPCMHCENAPCESVCPVNATSHSEDGLNQMTYNRCIGTRYCNNNCPYKVRRFNFYAWWKRHDLSEVEKMAMNPDVTVRMRGVMEKCTYCVQRINRAKIDAKNQDRPVRDGEIVTACQQACPTESIVFGDILDPESRVAKLKAQNRDYTLIPEIYARPRTSYQARIRNPNPELERPA